MNRSNLIKLSVAGVVVILLVYVGSVVWFEARLGINQPQGSTSMVIATFNEDAERHERVLRLEQIDNENYIAANHWPRAWYRQAMNNPEVEVKLPGTDAFAPFTAVPLDGEELALVTESYQVGSNFRFRTGYPPRRFMRLDPR